ncbi:nucleotide sugar dehydrogenase [Magnetospira sp. QH-2]|uniref:nucleotide sugar dehydrogenase n=1 Tax=Magnetospira sp. (strain QH-2) TaxID=1288970 RepID=UPI0003E80E81|nr:nucleotide sugar dehydrogenase [Magnetospira sp. QH-2]CCQ72869.1 UDP-glucose/GDP-mannose dehydrogenase family protein; putative Capsular polysaccharide biosynthesis protein [Magnetospira sp. QH-2]
MAHQRSISVIGLGYVGLPVAVAFGKKGVPVVAFDVNEARVAELRDGHDSTGEVEDGDLRAANMVISSDPEELRQADFHIVAVPTPITADKRPDLSPLIGATRTLGKQLKKGDVVVYESTVYPGATEESCVPVLEAESGLTNGTDFTVGYSPERINPGDKEHRFENIVKVVSGQDAATLDLVADVYGSVVEAGVHRTGSIKAAEAAKVIENTQRDLNIALMNELALIFNRLGIDTREVLEAAGTKWNFLRFTPGLVGGHCIGVDPYYLTYRAEATGYIPEVILAGRRINDGMGAWVADMTIKRLLRAGVGAEAMITVLGITFKEDVPDIRNTRVVDIVRELEAVGFTVQIADPHAEAAEVAQEYGMRLTNEADLKPADAVILAVAHEDFISRGWGLMTGLLKNGKGLAVDVRAALDREACPDGVDLWRV